MELFSDLSFDGINLTPIITVARAAGKQGHHLKELSLIGGKMGLCLNLFEISRVTGDILVRNYADEQFELLEAQLNLGEPRPWQFANGHCGIGYGLELLAQRGCIDPDVWESLIPLDKMLFETKTFGNIAANGIEDGVLGLAVYFIERLRNPMLCTNELHWLLTQQHLVTIIEHIAQVRARAMFEKHEPHQTFAFTKQAELAKVLVALHDLNIYNFLVDQLISWQKEQLQHRACDNAIEELATANALAILGQKINVGDNVEKLFANICPDKFQLEMQQVSWERVTEAIAAHSFLSEQSPKGAPILRNVLLAGFESRCAYEVELIGNGQLSNSLISNGYYGFSSIFRNSVSKRELTVPPAI